MSLFDMQRILDAIAVTAVSFGFVIEAEETKLVLRAEESFRTNLF